MMLAPPLQRQLLERIEQHARRMELVAALLGGGGLSPAQAARIVRAELHDLEGDAEEAQLDALATLLRSTGEVLARMDTPGSVPVEHSHDVLVLDDDEVTRDLIALAVEAQGHRVRVAANLAEFLALFRERRPDVVLTEAEIPGAPVDSFCRFLRERMSNEAVPIVMFASASGDELAMLALNAGADRYLCKDQGMGELTVALNLMFEEILF